MPWSAGTSAPPSVCFRACCAQSSALLPRSCASARTCFPSVRPSPGRSCGFLPLSFFFFSNLHFLLSNVLWIWFTCEGIHHLNVTFWRVSTTVCGCVPPPRSRYSRRVALESIVLCLFLRSHPPPPPPSRSCLSLWSCHCRTSCERHLIDAAFSVWILSLSKMFLKVTCAVVRVRSLSHLQKHYNVFINLLFRCIRLVSNLGLLLIKLLYIFSI